MDTPSLESDESVILAMQDIVANAVRSDVILTSNRLIIGESELDTVHTEDIPFESIGPVVVGENAISEPTITLSIIPKGGETRTIELVFFQRPGMQRKGECHQLVAKLKEHITPSLVQAPQSALFPPVQVTGAELGTSMPVNKRTTPGSSRSRAPSLLEALLDRIPLMAFPALLVIFVAVVGGGVTYIKIQQELPMGHSGSAAISPITMGAAGSSLAVNPPAVQQAPAPQVIPQTTAPEVKIPQSGVWVRVQYAGRFIGSVGARGVFKQVNATGDQFYQVPARDDIVEVSIEKQDGSNDPLAVEVYQDGTLVQKSSTIKPSGTIDLHANLKS